MKKSYKIAIPKPCHEEWNTMTPSEKGRFCNSCKKVVIDFTKMSSPQIHEFIEKKQKQNQKVCGHFKKTQLDTIHLSVPIHILKAKHSFRKSFLLALLIAMGTTLINCTNHNGKKQKIENIELKETVPQKENCKPENDYTAKKCSKIKSVSSSKKNDTTITTPTETLGITVTPPEPPMLPEIIEELTGDLEIVVGLLEHNINKPINLNYPIPAHLLDTFPALPGTPEKRRTSDNYSKQMKKFVKKHFNVATGKNLGLVGRHRLYVQYEINKNGIIKDIKVRAPHPDFEKEAKRVIKKMPKLIPGVYQNNAVSTRYTLPIVFNIEE